MTSGPMRAGAMPPDRQPDPQVVAWMRGYRAANPHTGDAEGVAKARASRAWLDAHSYKQLSDSPRRLRELVDAYDASVKPLAVADIPAGQGAASLYIGPGRYGELAVMYRTGLAYDHVFMTEGPDDPSEARRAMWEHLAATLPTVDTTETIDLTPLFDTPQIHTDTDGRHWDETGREHRAVDIDGETTYQPTDTTEESE